jgi:beta-glucosidase
VLQENDLATIGAPIDFLGVNTYRRHVVAARNGRPQIVRPAGRYTTMDWEVYPAALHRLLVRLTEDYAPAAIYVTENGAAYEDVRSRDGRVHDSERIGYLEAHVGAVARALDAGVPVGGYFVWSLLDNFEWAEGYTKRFGLVYVDYPTLQRIPKDSFYWYRDLIARQAVPAVAPAASTL